MTLIEVDKRRFINMDNVFKFELIQLEKSDQCFYRFYGIDDSHMSSKEFESEATARDWMNLQIMRAAGSNEILELH